MTENTANGAGGESAKLLGDKFRAAREKNGATLTQVSEQLNIRSYLLNDMEKGRFGHLKLGDCLAYAKYLGADISVDEIRQAKAAQTRDAPAGRPDRRVYIGAAVAIGLVALAAAVLSALSGGDGDKNAAGEGGERGVIEFRADGPALPKDKALAEGVDNDVTVSAPPAREPVSEPAAPGPAPAGADAIAGPGAEPGSAAPADEPVFKALPDVIPETAEPYAPEGAPLDGVVVGPAAGGSETAAPAPAPAPSAAPAPEAQPAPQPAPKPAVKPAPKPKPAAKPAPKPAAKPAAGSAAAPGRVKATGLKAGQVVSLAEEMGYKKPAAAKDGPAKSGAPAAKTIRTAPAKAAPAAPAASGRVKATGLKAGQVVSLAEEMGYKKPAAAKDGSVKSGAPAEPAKTDGAAGAAP